MGFLYFDESIRDKGGFIIGALVYSAVDLTPLVIKVTQDIGLDPERVEYKSSDLKAGNLVAIEWRERLISVIQAKAKLALVVCPNHDRGEIGNYALALVTQLSKLLSIPRKEHLLLLDQGISVKPQAREEVERLGVMVCTNQNSKIVAGLQLADIAAHLLGGMLLEGMGILNKTVLAGEISGYAPETKSTIGFKFWTSLRYTLIGSPGPIGAAIGHDVLT